MAEKIDSNTQENEISLRELILKIKGLFHFLLKKWIVILVFALLGAALGLVNSLLSKPKYVAQLTFAVQEKGSSGGGLAALAGQFGVNVGGTEGIFSGNNIIELLKSRHLIEKALLFPIKFEGKEQRLIQYYLDNVVPQKEVDSKKKLELISFPVELKRENFSRAQDSTLNVFTIGLKANLIISKISKESSIIGVKFTSNDELFSKYLASILVDEVIKFYVQSRTEVPQNNLLKMETRADSVKQKLDYYMMKRAVDADRNVDAARQIIGVNRQKDELNIQMLSTIYAELIKNIEAVKLDIIRETPLIQIIDTPILPLEKVRLGKMKGMVIGGFLGGFLIVCYLLGGLFYRHVMSEGESNNDLS